MNATTNAGSDVMTGIFTPRHFISGVRAEMSISESDYQVMKANKGRQWTSMHDYKSGTNFMVKSASCGARCRCDAIYKEIGE